MLFYEKRGVKRSRGNFRVNFTLKLYNFPYISLTYISDRDFRIDNKDLGLITVSLQVPLYLQNCSQAAYSPSRLPILIL
ncbi:MAG: hypothetical protein E6L03_05910 [Thaumarchaeota archaeon]|nr:MAG: hypothetical protein E6L03_05910 [Nitrososphaerota archaeon]